MVKKEDLVGKKFNYLTVIGEGERKGCHRRVVCKCDCGKEVLVRPYDLKKSKTISCGCQQINRTKQFNTTHGMTGTKTYNAWKAMKNRCNSPNNLNYHNYGGRGITYDTRWEEFENFLSDMGEAPKGLTLERVDVDANYCKENCVWATVAQQARSQRKTVLTRELASYVKGYYLKGGNMSQLCRESNIAMTTLSKCARGITWKDVEPDMTV